MEHVRPDPPDATPPREKGSEKEPSRSPGNGDSPGSAAGDAAAPSPVESGGELSHLAPGGRRARMVDVGAKAVTERAAEARAFVRFPNGILSRVLDGGGPKGPIEEVARAAGILAAKRTAELIPMCHPLGLDHLEIRFAAVDGERLEIRCRAKCTGRTGVEMEAMVGASVAALTVYDMTKALDHGIVLERVELLEKRGGKSGHWRAEDA